MSGISLRQTLPKISPTTWASSPDLMPFAAPVSDTSFLTTLYGTAFAQPPVPAQANTVYVRGQNSGSGAATANVTVWWVEHYSGLMPPAPDAWLDPSQWSGAQFTVGGKATNVVSLKAANTGDVVLSAPLTWTPTALRSPFGRYLLIAWFDDGSTPPPDFSTMKPFTNAKALSAYVLATPNLVMTDTSYSGMLARQYPDQTPTMSSPDATWTDAPDLIAYTNQAAYDPSLLTRTFSWTTQQPPVAGQGSNLYLRGVDTATAGTTAKVSFFYAANAPGTSPNPLLDPTTWKSDGMTVAGAAGNTTSIASNAPGDLMLNASAPVVWTPAAAAPAGTTYALIAWIDNYNGADPPPFASMAKFSSLATLDAYLAGTGNVVMWDGIDRTLFIRQFGGQTAGQPGTGAQTSPDIISTGAAPSPNAATFTDQGQYDGASVAASVSTAVPNFLYLRVINPSNGAQKARVYLYAGDNSAPSLAGLSSGAFTVAGKPQNWVDLEADTANEILVSTVPVVWTPPAAPPGSKGQFLLTYVDGSDDPQPPAFSEVGYGALAAIQQFVATQPQLSWVAVTNTAPSPVPTFTKVYGIPPKAAGTYYVGVQMQNMPADGSFTVGVPGPDSADTLVISSFHAPTPNAAVVWKVTYPADFATSLVVSYWQGPTTPTNASATLVVLPGS